VVDTLARKKSELSRASNQAQKHGPDDLRKRNIALGVVAVVLVGLLIAVALQLGQSSRANLDEHGFAQVTLTNDGGIEQFSNDDGTVVAILAYEPGAFPEALAVGFKIDVAKTSESKELFRFEADQHLTAAPGKRVAIAIRIPDFVQTEDALGSFIPIFPLAGGELQTGSTAANQDGSRVVAQVVAGKEPGVQFAIFGIDHFSGYGTLQSFLDQTRGKISGFLSNGERVAHRQLVPDKDGNTVALWLPSGFLEDRVLTAWSGSLRSAGNRQKIYQDLLRKVFLQLDVESPPSGAQQRAEALADSLDWVGVSGDAAEVFLRGIQLGSSALAWTKTGGTVLRVPAGRILRDFFVATGTFASSHSTFHAAFMHLSSLSDRLAGQMHKVGNVGTVIGISLGVIRLADNTMRTLVFPTALHRAEVERRMALFENMLKNHPGGPDPALKAAYGDARQSVLEFMNSEWGKFSNALLWAWKDTGATALTAQILLTSLAKAKVLVISKGIATAVAAKLGAAAGIAVGALAAAAVAAVVYTVIDIVDFEKTFVASSLSATLALEYLGPARMKVSSATHQDDFLGLASQELYADYLYMDFMHHGLKEFNVEAGGRWAVDSLVDIFGEKKCDWFDCTHKQPTFLAYKDWISREYKGFQSNFKKLSGKVSLPRAKVTATAIFDLNQCTVQLQGTTSQHDTSGPISLYLHPRFSGHASPTDLVHLGDLAAGPFQFAHKLSICTKPEAVLLQARPKAGTFGVKVLPVSCTNNKCKPDPYKNPQDQQTEAVEATIQQVDCEANPGKVMAYAMVTTQLGTPLEKLTNGNFKVEETVASFKYDCTVERVTTAEQQPDPLHVSLVIDSSSSMRGKSFKAAQNAAEQFVQNLQAHDRAAIVQFSSTVRTALDFTSDKQQLSNAIRSLHADGGTKLWDAVIYSLKATTNKQGRKVVVVLSDGDDTESSRSLNDTIQYAQKTGIPVYTIGLGVSPHTVKALRKLADYSKAGTKGQGYYHAPTAADLSNLYDSIATKLKKTYLVSWASHGMPGDHVTAIVDITYTGAHGTFTEQTKASYQLPPNKNLTQGVGK